MNRHGSETTIAPPTSNRFGAIAIKRGLLRNTHLLEAIDIQRAASRAGLRARLGEILIRKGYMNAAQVRQIMSNQPVDNCKKRIGPFKIIGKLGAGAMGIVYKARQVSLNRVVALKVLSCKLADSKSYRRRFLQEARSVAKLDHPHIVQAIDVGFANDEYYFAMEFVDGETLGERVTTRGGRLPETAALKFIEQIAQALQHAHSHGLLHRDVKPENILISKEGCAKLADLGLSRPRQSSKRKTEFGERDLVVGTPHYMSPEQAQASKQLTPASDLYSLGASLFFLITGRPPFEGPNSQVIMAKHCTEPVPDPRDHNSNLSEATSEICMRLLEKDPLKRFPNGKMLSMALQAALLRLQSPTEESTPIEGTKRVRRRRGRIKKHVSVRLRKVRLFRGGARKKQNRGLATAMGLVVALAGTVAIAFFLKDMF